MKYGATFLFLFAAFSPVPSWAAADVALSAEANQAFLAANARKNGVISLADGLQYRSLQNGPGRRPGPTDIVRIGYSAKLINGLLFDGTSPGLPVTVGVNGLIRGLNETLLRMHAGDHWQIVIPADLAYGTAGAGGGLVPPGQALVFDLTLLAVLPPPPPGAGQSTTLSVLSTDREHSAFLTIHP